MKQFEASMFHMVVHWHKLGEVENECTLHNFVVLAINVPKIIKVSKNLTKLSHKNYSDCLFWDTVYRSNCRLLSVAECCWTQFEWRQIFGELPVDASRRPHWWREICVSIADYYEVASSVRPIANTGQRFCNNNVIIIDWILYINFIVAKCWRAQRKCYFWQIDYLLPPPRRLRFCRFLFVCLSVC